MKGFAVWFAATMALGWYFDVLGRHSEPVMVALVLVPWLVISCIVALLWDVTRLEQGERRGRMAAGASNTSASSHSR